MSISKTLIYSYKFGQEVVQKFTERYVRGTYFVANMCGICHEELCERLISEVRESIQVDWESSKLVIKRAEVEHFRDYKHVPIADRRKYLKSVKDNAKEDYYNDKFAQNTLDPSEEFA